MSFWTAERHLLGEGGGGRGRGLILFLSFLYLYYLEIFCEEDLTILLYLLYIQSLYLYQSGLVEVCFILWLVIGYNYFPPVVPVWLLAAL